jgi:hypothetical protein
VRSSATLGSPPGLTQERPFTLDELRQFTGTDTWYRHSIVRNVTYRFLQFRDQIIVYFEPFGF